VQLIERVTEKRADERDGTGRRWSRIAIALAGAIALLFVLGILFLFFIPGFE
jgi:hypothetical protein